MKKYSGWLNKFIDALTLKKEAIDKLPEQELNGEFPPFTGDPSQGGQPGGAPGAPMDSSMGGGMPPMDPMMMGMPPMEEEPLVWDNKYLVRPTSEGPEFIIELKPSIVTKPMPGMSPAGLPQAQVDPMADTSMNPGADPQALDQWYQQNLSPEKSFGNTEQGTVDPLSQQEEGLPIDDVGNEQALNPKVKVHQKRQAAMEVTPGADKSNAYYPCAVCANYIASDNKCAQGLDVEKVQAAKSCSWLNSNLKPFNDLKDIDEAGRKDKDTVKSDVADIGGGGGEGMGGSGKFAAEKLKNSLKKLW